VYPFERLTERGKKVLTLAQEEAERSHHSYMGTEHLLLGLLREGEGLAAKVLNNLGVEINTVRSTIESVLGRNERLIIQQIIPTSRVKRVIQLAFEEARRMGTNYVGTQHLLLGLLIEGEGIAAHVLDDPGANLEKVRAEIDRLHHETPPEGPSGEAEAGRGAERGAFGPPPAARFGGTSPSGGDEIGRAAERLAAEQHTVVGLEHATPWWDGCSPRWGSTRRSSPSSGGSPPHPTDSWSCAGSTRRRPPRGRERACGLAPCTHPLRKQPAPP
jgi:ATP-dependent Clp protease ATP-binding subunit ClpA